MDLSLEKTIKKTKDVNFLAKLDHFIDIDIANLENDVNKQVQLLTGVVATEREYEYNKQRSMEHFLKCKKIIKRKLDKNGKNNN